MAKNKIVSDLIGLSLFLWVSGHFLSPFLPASLHRLTPSFTKLQQEARVDALKTYKNKNVVEAESGLLTVVSFPELLGYLRVVRPSHDADLHFPPQSLEELVQLRVDFLQIARNTHFECFILFFTRQQHLLSNNRCSFRREKS